MSLVLVVDDNPVNSKLVRVVLTCAGYEVLTAGDAVEALSLMARRPPQLVLMDLQLPGMDGLELTRLIKAAPATAHVPVVALTAYAMRGDEERALAAGCAGYIAKPIDTRALPGLVARHLVADAGGA